MARTIEVQDRPYLLTSDSADPIIVTSSDVRRIVGAYIPTVDSGGYRIVVRDEYGWIGYIIPATLGGGVPFRSVKL